MNITPNTKSQLNSSSFASSSPNNNSDDKHLALIEKFVTDLEDLTAKLVDIQQENPDQVFTDDCPELQKFCFKLEFLIQFRLKEKKSFFDTSNLSVANNIADDGNSQNPISIYSSKDYWVFFIESLKSSRGFQDAIKYVKGLNELKTNLGRGRAFIRFCLQYHRLADAIQQIFMEEKKVNNWYKDKAIWYNESQKSRVFQLLYDINEINFELLSKNNFELDTTWPTLTLNNPNNPKIQVTRHRTNSLASYTSYYVEKEQGENLLSSTPHDIDGEHFLISKMNQSSDNKSMDLHSSYQMEFENQEAKITELTNKLALKDNHLDINLDELKTKKPIDDKDIFSTTKSEADNDSTMFLEKMAAQIDSLNDQLRVKVHQNNDLNNCLIKQTNMCENLSDLMKENQDKIRILSGVREKNLDFIERQQGDFDMLNKEYNILKMELNSKVDQEEKLVKETLSQNQSIISLKQNCSKQEITINQLKIELNLIKDERQTEIDENARNIQHNLVQIQLKTEEIFLLNEQIQKLSRALDEERKQYTHLEKDISWHTNVHEENKSKIEQLEDDNNEIKKRLVKLIKEKAELWQKADSLEYENLIKVNVMWVDDAHVTKCLTCNSSFNILLRKHHCRVCLKIYCYYCCNNWVDYNNSKLRVCQRCFESRGAHSQITNNIPKISTKEIENIPATNPDSNRQPLGIEAMTLSANDNHTRDLDETESDPDINFEVRSEKLNLSSEKCEKVIVSSFNSACQSGDEPFGSSIYSVKSKNVEKSNEKEESKDQVVSNPLEESTQSIKEEQIMEASMQNTENLEEIPNPTLNLNVNEMTSIYLDESPDFVVRKKKIIKRKKKIENKPKCNSSIDDLKISDDNKSRKSNDSFTILDN